MQLLLLVCTHRCYCRRICPVAQQLLLLPQDLSLSRNHVGVEGARQLSLGLAASTSLQGLGLEACKLRAEGVQHLAQALAGNSACTTLNLARCGVWSPAL